MQSKPVLKLERGAVNNYSIRRGEKVYSGVAVQLIRAPQPLQLINPLAPETYQSGRQNVVYDPLERRPVGLKLFSLSF